MCVHVRTIMYACTCYTCSSALRVTHSQDCEQRWISVLTTSICNQRQFWLGGKNSAILGIEILRRRFDNHEWRKPHCSHYSDKIFGKKRLKVERVYLGPEFESTVHHSIEKALTLWGNWRHCIQSLESERGCDAWLCPIPPFFLVQSPPLVFHWYWWDRPQLR